MKESEWFVGKYTNVYKVKYNGETMYNVLMENHELMNVNNMKCETLNPENNIAKIYLSSPLIIDNKTKNNKRSLSYRYRNSNFVKSVSLQQNNKTVSSPLRSLNVNGVLRERQRQPYN